VCARVEQPPSCSAFIADESHLPTAFQLRVCLCTNSPLSFAELMGTVPCIWPLKLGICTCCSCWWNQGQPLTCQPSNCDIMRMMSSLSVRALWTAQKHCCLTPQHHECLRITHAAPQVRQHCLETGLHFRRRLPEECGRSRLSEPCPAPPPPPACIETPISDLRFKAKAAGHSRSTSTRMK